MITESRAINFDMGGESSTMYDNRVGGETVMGTTSLCRCDFNVAEMCLFRFNASSSLHVILLEFLNLIERAEGKNKTF